MSVRVRGRVKVRAVPRGLSLGLGLGELTLTLTRALRATLPFLETPLRLWLARLPAEERPT